MDLGFIGWNFLFLLVGAGVLVVWFLALLQISRSQLDTTAKAIWVLIVVVAPFLGALAWFLVGSQQAPPLMKR